MKTFLTKLTTVGATSAALSMAIALSNNNPAQAITFNYSFLTDTGYTGTGQFSYDETTAPPIISEAGSGPTNDLESLSLSVFAPAGNLLDSGNEVVNGVSNDPFFRFEFDPLTQTLAILDNSTDLAILDDFAYFISNVFDPNNNPVPPGSTTFNLFFITSTQTATFLGSASSIQVASTPEPSSILGLLTFGSMAVCSALKRKQS